MTRSATAQRSRKRRGDDAQEGTPATRRRRLLLSPSSFSPARSFGLRAALTHSPRPSRKRRHHDDASCSAGLRHRRNCRLGPTRLPPVRSFSLRVLLPTGPCLGRKRRVVNARHSVSIPLLRRRRHSGLLHFPGPRPFALRFLLAAAASAPRLRRKPASVGMGNCIARLLGHNTVKDGLEVHRGRVQERRSPPYKETVQSEWNHDGGRLLETEFLPSHQESPGVPAYRHDKGLSDLFEPLSYKEEIEVNAVLHDSARSDEIIVTHEPSNIEITKGKLQCLRPRGWLNDEVINLYLELLKERAEREPGRFLRCHFFNTFFYKKLTCGVAGYDYESVRRWTTFKKLGYGLNECDKIFVPIHREVHWCLAIINMKDRTFQYLDSLGGMGHDVLRVLARYIMDELKDKNNIEIDVSSWEEASNSCPLQKNGWDCGMFMLKFIDFHSRGLEPHFSQEHMVYFRKRTAKEIMRLRAD